MTTLDKNITIAATTTILLIALTLWRGTTIALGVSDTTPANGLTDVSVRTEISAHFDADLASTVEELAFQISPPVSGTLAIQGNTLRLQPAQPLQPGTAYTVTVGGADAQPIQGEANQQLREPLIWHFRTAQTQIVYAALDEQNREQLFVAGLTLADEGEGGALDAAAGAPEQITDTPITIWDFSVSPDGAEIVYTELNENGTSDLWQLPRGASEADILLACPDASCSSPAWTPNGQLLAFTRRGAETLATTGGLSPPRIWLLDPATGETAELFNDGQTLGFNARWSASGEWLNYLAPDVDGVGLYNVETGQRGFIPTSTGEGGAWHPAEDLLFVGIMQPQGDQYPIHLHQVDPAALNDTNTTFIATEATDLSLASGYAAVEDTSPALSPDGTWIALRRKELEGERTSLGKQIWVMRVDGSDARPLTADPEYDHGQPAWSPDGRTLLYHRFPLQGPDITLSLWIADVESGQTVELFSPGQRPLWLP